MNNKFNLPVEDMGKAIMIFSCSYKLSMMDEKEAEEFLSSIPDVAERDLLRELADEWVKEREREREREREKPWGD